MPSSPGRIFPDLNSPPDPLIVNPDEIQRRHQCSAAAAARLAVNATSNALAVGADLVVETTLAGNYALNIMRNARERN